MSANDDEPNVETEVLSARATQAMEDLSEKIAVVKADLEQLEIKLNEHQGEKGDAAGANVVPMETGEGSGPDGDKLFQEAVEMIAEKELLLKEDPTGKKFFPVTNYKFSYTVGYCRLHGGRGQPCVFLVNR